MADEPTYTARVSLSALKHLGIGLHSSITAVLSEAVANAWDADATVVSIDISENRVVIRDDGSGMTVRDANDKYLNVGYERRKEGDVTAKFGRPVMGRRGIGKLSLFSIADAVEITSAGNGEPHGFVMDANDIRKAAQKPDGAYNPKPVKVTRDLKPGTRIVLSSLKRVGRPAVLKRGLARRFSVVRNGGNFSVRVNGEDVTKQDTGYYKNLEYAWGLGEKGRGAISGAGGIQDLDCDPVAEWDGRTARLDGWIGTVKKAGQLKDHDAEESINRITVMIRGKMAQEDILGGLENAGAYNRYVVGEVYADFLDRGDGSDVATTNGQQIMEDSPEYRALLESVRKILRHVGDRWTSLRGLDGEKAALKIPQIKGWFDGLSPDRGHAAQKLFGRIHALPIDDEDEKRRAFVSGILAFESLELKGVLNKLEKISADDLPSLTRALSRLGDLEAGAYYQTAKTRLGAIDALFKLTDQNARERAIQECILDHLWLLDPSWDRAAPTKSMEKSIMKALDNVYDGLAPDQKKSRLGIKYRAAGGKHVIIELKRPGAVASTVELLGQILEYGEGVRSVLARSGKGNEPVEFVCVLGRDVEDWGNVGGRTRSENVLEAYSARIVMYDELIHSAQAAYREYVDGEEKASRACKLITSITDEDGRAMGAAGGSPSG